MRVDNNDNNVRASMSFAVSYTYNDASGAHTCVATRHDTLGDAEDALRALRAGEVDVRDGIVFNARHAYIAPEVSCLIARAHGDDTSRVHVHDVRRRRTACGFDVFDRDVFEGGHTMTHARVERVTCHACLGRVFGDA